LLPFCPKIETGPVKKNRSDFVFFSCKFSSFSFRLFFLLVHLFSLVSTKSSAWFVVKHKTGSFISNQNMIDIDEAMNEDHSHGGQNDGAVYGAGDTHGGQNECEGGLSDGENECKEDGRVEAVVGVFGDDEENENYRDTPPCSDSEEDQ
ncbi:BnaCnng73130D, partial [Brassica napus]